LYFEGDGVIEDFVEAYKWSNLAAAQGDKRAKGRRDDVTKKMTIEQIAEAQKLSREWLDNRQD
jgi:TPR repeat protein